MRQKLIIGNWKMNGDSQQHRQLLERITAAYRPCADTADAVVIVVCPPAPYLQAVQQQLATYSGSIKVGAQTVSDRVSGAYTGEWSATMLQDIGCEYVLVGHSERRVSFHEDDILVAHKVSAALHSGVTPVLCVGETAQEFELGQTQTVVGKQLKQVISIVGISHFDRVVIAYEPVWAIGSGKVATPEYVQSVHAFIRQQLAQRESAVAEKAAIIYGGSVNPTNAAALFAQPDIDGALVGGASLSADQFVQICALQNRQTLQVAS